MRKKHLVICTIIIVGLSIQTELSGQIKEGSLSFSLSVGAQNSTEQTGGISNFTVIHDKSFSVFPSIDYYLSDNFFIGLKTGYSRENREIKSNHFEYDYYQEVTTNTKTDLYHFSIRAGQGTAVTERFYLQFISGLNYAHLVQDMKYLLVGGDKLRIPGLPSISNPANLGFSSDELNDEAAYASLSLQPQISYFVSNSIGINLSLGGFEYGIYDWDIKNDLWILSFRTNLWILGVNFTF